ncbi:hypothetical protein Ahy_A06g029707 [Arachis hypogaea]|uniref:Uncharacterized protein n=1 Tax=Arachis hypogaea TaxID=3818 RepID=A0A445CTZ7_ARAHY|nr:hypothetical protein Ahy_A06g029707 [Arachis hypogaea]
MPTERQKSHLRPLHITTTLSEIKVNKVLIDGGVAISLLLERMLMKVGKHPDDLVHTNIAVTGFSVDRTLNSSNCEGCYLSSEGLTVKLRYPQLNGYNVAFYFSFDLSFLVFNFLKLVLESYAVVESESGPVVLATQDAESKSGATGKSDEGASWIIGEVCSALKVRVDFLGEPSAAGVVRIAERMIFSKSSSNNALCRRKALEPGYKVGLPKRMFKEKRGNFAKKGKWWREKAQVTGDVSNGEVPRPNREIPGPSKEALGPNSNSCVQHTILCV